MKWIVLYLVLILVALSGLAPVGAIEEFPFSATGGTRLHTGGGGPLAIDVAVVEGDSVRFSLIWLDSAGNIIKREPRAEIGVDHFTSYGGMPSRYIEFDSPGPDSLAVDMLSATKAIATWK